MSHDQRVRLGGLLLAAGFIVLSWSFVVFHLLTPTDGLLLEPGEPVWQTDGVLVSPLSAQPNGVRAGDVVVAVAGRSMEQWAKALSDLRMPRPYERVGQTLIYTVLREGRRLDVPVTLTAYPLSAVLAHGWSALLFTLFSQAVLTFVFLLKPNDRAARALFLWAWSLSHTYPWALGMMASDVVSGVGYWLYRAPVTLAWLIFWSAILDFSLVYPHKHPLLVRRPWLTPVIFVTPYVFFPLYLLAAWLSAPSMLSWLSRWTPAEWLAAIISLTLSLIVVAHTYRTMPDFVTRQKIRWLMFAFVLSGGTGLVLWFVPGLLFGSPLIDASGLGLTLLPFPVILALAIARHQLFDIDFILRRTLIYGVLTALLALTYVVSVIVLQTTFGALIGQNESELVTVLSTLLIAALFVPLRQRVQSAIDKRFFRRKYDTTQVLARFSASVRDEVDLKRLSENLLRVVDETMQPTHVSLWLRAADRSRESGERRVT